MCKVSPSSIRIRELFMSNRLTTAPTKAVAYIVTKIEGIPHPAERATTSIRTSPVKLNDFATYDLTHSLAVYSRQYNSPRALTQDPSNPTPTSSLQNSVFPCSCGF
ncbi:hypothetical protein M438DRAFT_157209 [Aureobasidium pullulans EXF-150]|uniref:Uncharacterized protein n=1 Tax=Aureobasidium pullulans EXF-150 TaxID=1043002 RepID=A0A074YIQ2_AURPU|nr:uncharacterized protein M438DRAFT_157209 [Aureobasidium pullulans EXF-150]KEQ86771.1 hypothetical protein M438DRAFT_157209 [Aureobasidium pullulans EXF-150]